MSSSILHSLGEFGSNCTSKADGTVWIHKNTCDCEKKTLVDYFKKKVSFSRHFLYSNMPRKKKS